MLRGRLLWFLGRESIFKFWLAVHIFINLADVPHIDKQNYQKKDEIDSNNLSKQLQSDTLRANKLGDI